MEDILLPKTAAEHKIPDTTDQQTDTAGISTQHQHMDQKSDICAQLHKNQFPAAFALKGADFQSSGHKADRLRDKLIHGFISPSSSGSGE